MFSPGIVLHSAVKVTAAAPPVFISQTGQFIAPVAGDRIGAGNYTLNFILNDQLAALDGFAIASSIVAGVASGLTSCQAVLAAAGATCGVTILQEAAMGGASTLADVNFQLICYRNTVTSSI